jgi:hypothetical protein
MEGSMETVRQLRATAYAVANATLLVAIFAGLSHNMPAAFALAAAAMAIITAAGRLPVRRRAMARARTLSR